MTLAPLSTAAGSAFSRVIHGDCTAVLRDLAAEGFLADGCVTDPPCRLASIVSRLGSPEHSSRGKPENRAILPWRSSLRSAPTITAARAASIP